MTSIPNSIPEPAFWLQRFLGFSGARGPSILPQHVQDHPASLPLDQLQVVDPRPRIDFRNGRVLKDVEDLHVGLPTGLWRLPPAAVRRIPDQLGSALVLNPRPPHTIQVLNSLDELRMECPCHPCGVDRIPPLDIV